jgi:hypothetical protein
MVEHSLPYDHAVAATAHPAAGANARSLADTSKVIATVLETMDASNYTYVSVKADSGNWAASSQFTVAVGDTVVLFARPADGEFPEPGAQSRLSLDLFCVALRAARPRGGTR